MKKIIAIILCVVVLLSGCSSNQKPKSQIAQDYESACEYYENGEFEQAYELLQNTQSYNDSEKLRNLSYVMMMIQGTYDATVNDFTINKFDVEKWFVRDTGKKTTITPLTKSSIKFQSDDDSEPSNFTVIIEDDNVILVGESGIQFKKKKSETAKLITEPITEPEIETTKAKNKSTSADSFIKKVKKEIDDCIGKNEYILDVTLKNKNLCIYVDITKTDSSSLSYKELVIKRTSFITDDILDLDKFDNLWETITIDFGDLGYIKNSKSNIVDGEYARYFDDSNFVLENKPVTEPINETATSKNEPTSADKFIKKIKNNIDDCIGQNETILDVILDNNTLSVYVDISKANTTILTYEDIVINRTSSITDEILELSKFDNLWNAIIIDFGSLGYIKNKKSNIGDDGYGRYFKSSNFKLETK